MPLFGKKRPPKLGTVSKEEQQKIDAVLRDLILQLEAFPPDSPDWETDFISDRIAVVTKAWANDPTEIAFPLMIGNDHLALGDFAKAVATLEAALPDHEDDPRLVQSLANAYANLALPQKDISVARAQSAALEELGVSRAEAALNGGQYCARLLEMDLSKDERRDHAPVHQLQMDALMNLAWADNDLRKALTAAYPPSSRGRDADVSLLAPADMNPFCFRMSGPDRLDLEDIGGEYFMRGIDSSRYLVGFGEQFGIVIQETATASCIVAFFGDHDAPRTLVSNGFPGTPDVVRSVEVDGIGDGCAAQYWERHHAGSVVRGHTVEFCVDQVWAAFGYGHFKGIGPLSEAKRLASLMCERLRSRLEVS